MIFPAAGSADTVSSHVQNQTAPISTHNSGLKNHGTGPGVYKALPQIAGIWDPAESTTKNFTLKTDTILRLYGLGRGEGNHMTDYGGIEDCRTGQLIWMMHYLSTRSAKGSPKMRVVDRHLPLRAGNYRLHFKTDPSPALKSFQKGIWLFDETPAHPGLLNNFWKHAEHPEALGWSTDQLKRLIPEIRKIGTDALMIITNGQVVFEYGNTTNIIRSHSTRKSLLSSLYGIFTANGKIDPDKTLEQLGISDYSLLTPKEQQATIINLLKSRSGIYLPAAAESESMRRTRPKRGSHSPGSFWYYNNWDFNALGTIFRRETGEDIYHSFKKRISDPIFMQDFILDRQSYEYQKKYSRYPSYPFLISTRDMARFGQLFLQHGRWGSNQVIPEKWIEASTRSYSKTPRSGIGYGYMWWILTQDIGIVKKGSYFASGYGGQKLFIIPNLDSVIVHRIDIKIPGTNIKTSEFAPDAVIKRVMTAYNGENKKASVAPAPDKRITECKNHSLTGPYGRGPGYYGKSFRWFRSVFWACAAVFISCPVVWTLVLFKRKFAGSTTHTEPEEKMILEKEFKWTAALGSLVCSIYLGSILTAPYALEYIAMLGMPSGLTPIQKVLIHVPKFGGLFMLFLLGVTGRLWLKRYWSMAGRLYFTAITIAATVFIFFSFRLHLIVLL